MRNAVGVVLVDLVAVFLALVVVVNVSGVLYLGTSDSRDSTYPCTWKDMHFDSVVSIWKEK